jgi:hypothetical protein
VRDTPAARLEDDGGYVVQPADLTYVRVDATDLDAMLDRVRPLGTSDASFQYLINSLRRALVASGVTKCDVRLQGSASTFFSGLHKSIPWERDTIATLFEDLQDRVPHAFEVDRVVDDMNELWGTCEHPPRRRMFDLLHRLRIDPQPSDIDVQISSRELYAASVERLRALRAPESELRVKSENYGFIRKHIVKAVAPAIDYWADEQSAIHHRRVAVAVFPAEGPPPCAGTLSSHFRETDWKIEIDFSAGGTNG